MNIENIKAVRDAIADPATPFDMVEPHVCIGGIARRMFTPGSGRDVTDAVSEVFDMPHDMAVQVTYAYKSDVGLNDITSSIAIAMLDHLIETGKVDWDKAAASVEGAGDA